MVDRLIEYCIKNKVLVIFAFLLVIGFGIFSMINIPIDAIPDIGENMVIVFTDWPGRSPQDVEDQITYPLSSRMQGIPGVKVIRATSAFGFSILYIIFEDNIEYYWARSRVLERLNFAAAAMPPGVIPALGPDATGLGQIFWYTIEGSGRSLEELRTIQDWYVRFALNAVKGVSEVASVGGYVRQYQVDINPNRLLYYNIPMSKVFTAIRKSNIDVGAKVIENNNMEFIVRGIGFIKKVSDIEKIVIGVKDGVPITVKSVARVTVGPDFRRNALDKNGVPAVGGVVIMRYGENPLAVIERIKTAIKKLELGLPKGVKIVPFYDRTNLIYKTIATLRDALSLEIIITILVIVIFLFHFRSSIIISLTLPISILLAFIGMYLVGVDSNIMSLSGIIIAIGTIVDMGIIMLENIYRRRVEAPDGDVTEVTTAGSKEVGKAIVAAIMTTVISFIPVFALTGQEGRMFKPLAYTKTFTLLASVIVALTLVPVLALFFLKGKLRSADENFLSSWIRGKYKRGLVWVLKNKMKFLMIPIILVLVAGILFTTIGNEFMPTLDEGSFLFMPVLLPSASLSQVKEVMNLQDRIIKSFPEVKMVTGKLGRAETATDPAPVAMIESVILLHDKSTWRKVKKDYGILEKLPGFLLGPIKWIFGETRTITKKELKNLMDKKLKIPGVSNIWTQPIINRVDMLATGIRTSVGVKIFGNNLEVLQFLAQTVEKIVRKVKGATDLYSEKIVGKPYIEFHIDRDAISRYGIRIQDVQNIIATAIGGMNLTMTVEGRERYPIRVRYPRELRNSVDTLKRVLVPGVKGQQIPMAQLADIKMIMGPAMINSENNSLRAFVLLNVEDRDTVGFVEEARDTVNKKLHSMLFQETSKILKSKLKPGVRKQLLYMNKTGKLPTGYFIEWSGQFVNQVRAKKRLSLLVPLALLVNFMIIFMAFKSMLKSLIIFLAIPVSLAGGIILQFFFGFNFSVAVWVGFIALFGIAVDNGVVLTTYMEQLFREKPINSIQDIRNVVIEAGLNRIRPLMMTTMTTILALIPILFATGTGAEVVKPMAIPSVGGMGVVLITLYVVPVLYAALEEKKFTKLKRS